MSTYLSHPVRRIRDEPVEGARVELVVEPGDIAADALTSTVKQLSGTIVRELQFDCYLIDLPETAVDELCELDGLVRIETAETLSVAPRDAELTTDGELTDESVEPDVE